MGPSSPNAETTRITGRYVAETILAPQLDRLVIQHAGPKLSGYPTSTATRATVIQNPAAGWRSQVICDLALVREARGKGSIPASRTRISL